MYDIRKILLATSQNQQSRYAELRAALISAQLDVGAFDMIAIKHGTRAAGLPLTTFGHPEVRCGALRAWLRGGRQSPGAPGVSNAGGVPGKTQPLSAASVVVGRAGEMAADLTILAPPRRNAFLDMIAPSDSDEIIRRSRNAVLVVQSEPAAHYRRVLVAVDFSQSAFDAARTALALAPGAHLTFLHAYSLPDEGLMREFEVPASVIEAYRLRGVDSARERLAAWIDALKPVRQPRAWAVHPGFAVPAIRSCAHSVGADLIVVGRQGCSGSGRDALGKVPRRLMREAGCDLLIGPAATAHKARRPDTTFFGRAG